MTTLRFSFGILAFVVAIVFEAHGYFADDFSSGLIDWDTTGDVTVVADEAMLQDGLSTYSLMYQAIPLLPGTYTIEVDVRHEISPDIPSGQLPDVFFASLYFVDNPATFNLPGGSFDGGVPLFDIAATGFTNVQGTIELSAKGAEWSHYAGTFELTHAYAIPTFELKDDNAVVGDSSVRLDNLRIALIPEPHAIALLLAGLSTLAAIRHRARR